MRAFSLASLLSAGAKKLRDRVFFWQWGGVVFFLLLIAAAVAAIQFSVPYHIATDDGYQHLAIAREIVRHGPYAPIARAWLPISFFAAHPSDPWFLYHWMLVPFTFFTPLLVGLKVWIVCAVTALAASFYGLMRTLRVRLPALWTLLFLFGSASFFFRIQIGRPFTLTVAFFLFMLSALAHKKPLLLAAALGLAVLIHSFAVLLFGFALAYLAIEWWTARESRHAIRMCGGIFLGAAIGVFFRVNPFEFLQYFPIMFSTPLAATVNTAIRFGTEVYGADLGMLLGDSFLILGLWLPALAWGLLHFRNSTVIARYAIVMSSATYTLSLWSIRFFDFFVPLAVVAIAVIAKPIFAQRTVLRKSGGLSSPIAALMALFRGWERLLLVFLGLAVALFFASRIVYTIEVGQGATDPDAAFGETVRAIEDDWERRICKFTNLQNCQLVSQRPLIFNTQWDIFPMLFYLYPDAAYVAGMDPMLLYAADKEKFWLWHHLSNDTLTTCEQEQCTQYRDPVSVIRDEFRAQYVLVDRKRNPKLEQYLKAKKKAFALLGETERASAFVVK